ncbi:MAG: N-acetylneuraminate synthase family protein [Candidatus Woesearchaeota archaeon]
MTQLNQLNQNMEFNKFDRSFLMNKNDVFIISEIGINHNGSLELAKKLIDTASIAGCDFVKFQKRTPHLCVPEHQKNVIKTGTPWGDITYMDYKLKIEFGQKEFDEIALHCKNKGIRFFASVWDKPSCDFMAQYTNISKIPSALITNHELLNYARSKFEILLISTGMSTEEEIEAAIRIGNPDVIFHTNSSYPSKTEELNLLYIQHLKEKYPNHSIGYSGHEFGLVTTFATIPLGVNWVERHITLERTMWGSDQLASVEPIGIIKLVKGIRAIQASLGVKKERILLGSELEKRKSLRGN